MFFAIPEKLQEKEFEGVLLFVILSSCLIMAWGLIQERKKLESMEEEDFETIDSDISNEDETIS